MSDKTSASLGDKVKEGAKEGVSRAVATIVHYKIVALVAAAAVGAILIFNVPQKIAGFMWNRTAGAAIDAAGEVAGNAKDSAVEGVKSVWARASDRVGAVRDEWHQPKVFILEEQSIAAPALTDNDLVSNTVVAYADTKPAYSLTPMQLSEIANESYSLGDDLEIGTEKPANRFMRAFDSLKQRF